MNIAAKNNSELIEIKQELKSLLKELTVELLLALRTLLDFLKEWWRKFITDFSFSNIRKEGFLTILCRRSESFFGIHSSQKEPKLRKIIKKNVKRNSKKIILFPFFLLITLCDQLIKLFKKEKKQKKVNKKVNQYFE